MSNILRPLVLEIRTSKMYVLETFRHLRALPRKRGEKKDSTELYEDRDRKTQKIRKKPFLTG